MTNDTVKHSKLLLDRLIKLNNLSDDESFRKYDTDQFSAFMDTVAFVMNAKDEKIAEELNNLQQYREALEFYANPSDYHTPLTGGLGKLFYDCGEIARNALKLEDK